MSSPTTNYHSKITEQDALFREIMNNHDKSINKYVVLCREIINNHYELIDKYDALVNKYEMKCDKYNEARAEIIRLLDQDIERRKAKKDSPSAE